MSCSFFLNSFPGWLIFLVHGAFFPTSTRLLWSYSNNQCDRSWGAFIQWPPTHWNQKRSSQCIQSVVPTIKVVCGNPETLSVKSLIATNSKSKQEAQLLLW